MVRRGFAAALAAAVLLSVAEAQTLTGRASVGDGDTLRLAGETVRLHAIDAPETGQTCADADGRRWPCGRAAERALARLAEGGLRCEGRERDPYGRLVAKCYADGADVARRLVRRGAAFAYPQYGRDYVSAERRASAEGRGVWRGKATRPWAVRDARTAESDGGSQGCRIKGNISENGRIYHLPGQAFYNRTRISDERGERWFCSEAAARAAGWRRARR